MFNLFHFFLLLFLLFSTNANSFHLSSLLKIFKKRNSNSNPLPIDTVFKLPSPIPTWPKGEGFASGAIDLGGLQLYQISTFNRIFETHERGPDNLGATFFEPSSIPNGFFMLGSYAQPNNRALFGCVLVGKDLTNGALNRPIDYTLVWSSESSKAKRDGNGYIWLPTPPNGYKSVGYIVTNSSEKPPLDKTRCVRSDFADVCENDAWIWGENGMDFYGLRPSNRRVQAQGLSLGTFIAQNDTANNVISCLKNSKNGLSSMPNLGQVEALIQAYSPWVYFHPDEDFFPSSVSWFFKNGALLYKKGDRANPVSIEPNGSNLPLNGSNDGSYWLDLPKDRGATDHVKKGNLQDAGGYFHVKPMFGATYTDIVLWLFYPFNGNAKAKVGVINVSLGKIGEHVGDWEHVTLRISNFDGALKSVYFSQHSRGIWASASDVEFQGGNKLVTYSSLHSHAFQPKTGNVLLGGNGIGIQMEAAKGNSVIDTGVRFSVISAEYLGSTVVEPPWLNYANKWGPKIDYDVAEEIKKVDKVLPGLLRNKFDEGIRGLPDELLGEEGPTGPKMKNNWAGDENI